jgi:integrase
VVEPSAVGLRPRKSRRWSCDLVDPIIVLAATGLRESELLGLRWTDFDADAGTVTVTGKLVRATGHGLTRIDATRRARPERGPCHCLGLLPTPSRRVAGSRFSVNKR